jgi:hypothetical protein
LSIVITIALLGSLVLSFVGNVLDLSSVAGHMTFPKDGIPPALQDKQTAGLTRRGRVSNRLFKILNGGQVIFAIFFAIYTTLLLTSVIQIREIEIKGIFIDGAVFTFFYTLIVVALAAALLIKGLLGIKCIIVGDISHAKAVRAYRSLTRAGS